MISNKKLFTLSLFLFCINAFSLPPDLNRKIKVDSGSLPILSKWVYGILTSPSTFIVPKSQHWKLGQKVFIQDEKRYIVQIQNQENALLMSLNESITCLSEDTLNILNNFVNSNDIQLDHIDDSMLVRTKILKKDAVIRPTQPSLAEDQTINFSDLNKSLEFNPDLKNKIRLFNLKPRIESKKIASMTSQETGNGLQRVNRKKSIRWAPKIQQVKVIPNIELENDVEEELEMEQAKVTTVETGPENTVKSSLFATPEREERMRWLMENVDEEIVQLNFQQATQEPPKIIKKKTVKWAPQTALQLNEKLESLKEDYQDKIKEAKTATIKAINQLKINGRPDELKRAEDLLVGIDLEVNKISELEKRKLVVEQEIATDKNSINKQQEFLNITLELCNRLESIKKMTIIDNMGFGWWIPQAPNQPQPKIQPLQQFLKLQDILKNKIQKLKIPQAGEFPKFNIERTKQQVNKAINKLKLEGSPVKHIEDLLLTVDSTANKINELEKRRLGVEQEIAADKNAINKQSELTDILLELNNQIGGIMNIENQAFEINFEF